MKKMFVAFGIAFAILVGAFWYWCYYCSRH